MSRNAVSLRLVFALGLLSAAPVHALAGGAHGVIVPGGSKLISKDRFKSSKDFDRTLRFYRSVYRREKTIVFQHLPSPPAVKAMYIENTKPGASWEGINLYRTRGKVYIYIIANRNKKNSKSRTKK